jgi:hypothetical protein
VTLVNFNVGGGGTEQEQSTNFASSPPPSTSIQVPQISSPAARGVGLLLAAAPDLLVRPASPPLDVPPVPDGRRHIVLPRPVLTASLLC